VVFFLVVAAVAVAAAVAMVVARNSVHCALFLVVTFFCLAVLYLTLNAEFLAAIQIVVYAGAIMVLFLFVVMLLNAHTEDDAMPRALGPRGMQIGALLSVLLCVEVIWALTNVAPTWFGNEPGQVSTVSSVQRIGTTLFTTHAFAFEVTSILILVAMVGAVVIARREH
jgi:NADH-quinone oxidoreductase subunit J